jgi:hypothetical protein
VYIKLHDRGINYVPNGINNDHHSLLPSPTLSVEPYVVQVILQKKEIPHPSFPGISHISQRRPLNEDQTKENKITTTGKKSPHVSPASN